MVLALARVPQLHHTSWWIASWWDHMEAREQGGARLVLYNNSFAEELGRNPSRTSWDSATNALHWVLLLKDLTIS
jgi:hypothetical protein